MANAFVKIEHHPTLTDNVGRSTRKYRPFAAREWSGFAEKNGADRTRHAVGLKAADCVEACSHSHSWLVRIGRPFDPRQPSAAGVRLTVTVESRWRVIGRSCRASRVPTSEISESRFPRMRFRMTGSGKHHPPEATRAARKPPSIGVADRQDRDARHREVGSLRIVNVSISPFDPTDERLD